MIVLISQQAAIDAIKNEIVRNDCLYDSTTNHAIKDDIRNRNNQARKDIEVIESLPTTQPESYKEKLKEIADALSEKFAYMNTCLNERDIILGYLGVKRCCETHCNTDCTNTKCESHPLSSAQSKIIRCKECKFYTEMRTDLETGICSLACRHLGDDGFCSEAKRREG